jgi:hypothetical protein
LTRVIYISTLTPKQNNFLTASRQENNKTKSKITMPIAKSSGKGADPVPAGVHPAVCYSVVDLGTQDPGNSKFRPSRKVMITWELPYETINVEGKDVPRAISCEYTLSIGKKATLRAVLESWRGRPFTADELDGFDVSKLVGANCQLNVVHKPGVSDPSKVYARINGVMPLAKGQAKLAPVNPTVTFDIPEDGEIVIPKAIPEWVTAKIIQSEEYKARSGSSHTEATAAEPTSEESEDVPF